MKREKLRKHRIKQCVNLVELIRNRPRTQPYYCNCSRSYRRNGTVINNTSSENTNLSTSQTSQNQNKPLLPQNFEGDATVLNGNASHLLTVSRSRTNDSFTRYCGDYQTAYKASDITNMFSCGLVNSFRGGSSLTLNDSCRKTESVTSSVVNKTQCETEGTLCDISGTEKLPCSTTVPAVQENEMSSEIDNRPKLFYHSSVELNSKDSEMLQSINKELSAESSDGDSQHAIQQTTPSSFEQASSAHMLPDEEAGGDGHHNNSIIEIEITLHSSNDTNSEDEEGDDENLHDLRD